MRRGILEKMLPLFNRIGSSEKKFDHNIYLNKKKEWQEEKYSEWFINRKGKYIDRLEKEAFLEICFSERKFKNVIDVGIGNGRLLPAYKHLCNELIGVDMSFPLLQEASKLAADSKVKFKAIVAIAESLPFNRNTFDLIINSRMLQHCQDWEYALRSVCALSKNDSTIIIMVYNMLSLYGLHRYLGLFLQKFRNWIKAIKYDKPIESKFYGHFNNIFDIKNALIVNKFKIVKCIGVGLFPVEMIPERLFEKYEKYLDKFLPGIERLSLSAPLKYMCGRLLIIAERK